MKLNGANLFEDVQAIMILSNIRYMVGKVLMMLNYLFSK